MPMTDTALQVALDKKVGKRSAPTIGDGPIGPVTGEHIDRCNEWLKPLAQRDGFDAYPNLSVSDIENLLNMGRANHVNFAGRTLHEATVLRETLLIDMASVVRSIRWGMAPQEDEPTAEVLFRLTARGRRMLQQCCPDLWNKMLYGK